MTDALSESNCRLVIHDKQNLLKMYTNKRYHPMARYNNFKHMHLLIQQHTSSYTMTNGQKISTGILDERCIRQTQQKGVQLSQWLVQRKEQQNDFHK